MGVHNAVGKMVSHDWVGSIEEILKMMINYYSQYKNKKQTNVSILIFSSVCYALQQEQQCHSFKISKVNDKQLLSEINSILVELEIDNISIIADEKKLSSFVEKFKESNLIAIETVNGDGCAADIEQFYCTFKKILSSFFNKKIYENEILYKKLDIELQKINYNNIEGMKDEFEKIRDILVDIMKKLDKETEKKEENKNNILVISRGEFNREDYSEVLDLRKYFNNRFVKDIHDWNKMQNDIYNFSIDLKNKVNRDSENYIYLSAHLSLAYCTGACFNDKGMYKLNPMQKTRTGILDWSINPSLSIDDVKENMFNVTNNLIDENNTDIVISISTMNKPLYYGADSDLNLYLEANKLPVRRIIDFNLGKKGGNTSVQNGFHARILAEQVRKEIDNLSIRDKKGKMHIFLATPASLAFFLGQISFAYNRIQLYEFMGNDVEEKIYEPSMFIEHVDSLS